MNWRAMGVVYQLKQPLSTPFSKKIDFQVVYRADAENFHPARKVELYTRQFTNFRETWAICPFYADIIVTERVTPIGLNREVSAKLPTQKTAKRKRLNVHFILLFSYTLA
jgi:hypothetical protein